MQIVLTALDQGLTEAWQHYCGHLDMVICHQGSILDLSLDAVVSPANSFGFMDGGIDLIYSNYFGWGVQARLQALIAERHHGELLVGTAEIVETSDARIPFLIAAPTMRVPMILRETVNPYLAARAALLLWKHGTVPTGSFAGERVANVVRKIGLPGLGTGVGRVSPDVCAAQVCQAIQEVLLDKVRFPNTWVEAQMYHQQLYTDRPHDLQQN